MSSKFGSEKEETILDEIKDKFEDRGIIVWGEVEGAPGTYAKILVKSDGTLKVEGIATISGAVTVEQSDETKLKATVTQAEKDRSISNFPSDYPDASVLSKLDNPSDPQLAEVKPVTGVTWDVADRAARLLGKVYGSQGQQLLQRATTYDLLIQLRNAGIEIDPRNIRALTSSDVIDVSDKATRDLGKVDVAGFDAPLPTGANNIGDVDVLTLPSLPAGTNKIGVVDTEQSDETKLKATVTQSAKDRTITDISKTATQKKIDLTATGVIHTPSTGKKIRIKAFTWSSNADVVTALRFGTTGDLLFAIQAKGVIGMNLVGCNIEGGVDEVLYGYLSGTGTMKGTVLIEEI